MTRNAYRQISKGVAPDRKPLYILCPTPAHMKAGLDHLALYRESASTQRFPIARIRRVICNSNLSWTGKALALCLHNSIPITWANGSGETLGHTQSHFDVLQSASTLIDTYLELPDWADRFINWRARRRLEILTTCAERAIKAEQTINTNDFQIIKREFVYHGKYPITFNKDGLAWCQAAVTDRLQQNGLQSRYWGFNASQLDLVVEFADLLWAELNFDSGTLPGSVTHSKLSTYLFESWLHQHEYRLLLHLGDLKRHMAREVNQWQ
ncbi:CRISPR-associated endonuclease Cas1 [Kerstersia gyiorum]|uniref:CRISPR-associated endonuclease Cas1 n=1 Tax=Kerstersia gyiorum TaxID=206506 RepID=UPI003B437DD3